MTDVADAGDGESPVGIARLADAPWHVLYEEVFLFPFV